MERSTATPRERIEFPAAHPRSRRLAGLVWTVTLLATAADVATTVYGLHLGLREGNPVALAAIETFGVPGLVGLKLLALGFAGVCWVALSDERALVPPATLGAFTSVVVTLNLLTLFG